MEMPEPEQKAAETGRSKKLAGVQPKASEATKKEVPSGTSFMYLSA